MEVLYIFFCYLLSIQNIAWLLFFSNILCFYMLIHYYNFILFRSLFNCSLLGFYVLYSRNLFSQINKCTKNIFFSFQYIISDTLRDALFIIFCI